jgi:hypothetical protein
MRAVVRPCRHHVAAQVALGTADLGEALAAAKAALIGCLEALAVQLLVRINRPGGLPWDIIYKVIPEELAKRADRALADLQPEECHE